MNNELKIFENEQFGNVRVVEIDHEPWFVAADVCRALEIVDTWNALQRLESDEKGACPISTPGGQQEMSIVNEPGLYSLVLGSRKPEARAFKHWVTHEVIPSIRKTGYYAVPTDFISALRAYADELERNQRLEEEKKLAQPKVEYFDDLVDRNLLTNFRDTAKELEIKERVFIRFLEEYNYIYRDAQNRIKPFAIHVQDGLFEIKDAKSGHSKWAGNQTLITPKGKSTFQLLLPRWLKRQKTKD